MKANEFVRTVYSLNDNEIEQLNLIYSYIHSQLEKENYETIEWIFSKINPSEINLSASLSILTATWSWRKLLQNRRSFYEKVSRVPVEDDCMGKILIGLDLSIKSVSV